MCARLVLSGRGCDVKSGRKGEGHAGLFALTKLESWRANIDSWSTRYYLTQQGIAQVPPKTLGRRR